MYRIQSESKSSLGGAATIGAESVLILGGGRAILLQLAHVSVGAGVAEHSDFASDPLKRLRHTLAYVYVQVFGDDTERLFVRQIVHRAHDRVLGTGASGSSYSAHDPALQLWVAATLYDSARLMHESVYGPLDPATAELVYRDYAQLGTGLRMREEDWPSNTVAFGHYWHDALRGLQVSDQARRVARELLAGRTLPFYARLGMPLARLVTIGTLPSSIREAYGFAWSPRHERRFQRTMGLIRLLYPRLPRRLRHWPKNYLLRGVRRLVATG